MQDSPTIFTGLINIKEETQETQEKIFVYILTNGFLDVGRNYAKMFRTKESAIKYAKFNYINTFYDLHEVEVPAGSDHINIMTTCDFQRKYIVECVGDEMEFYNKILIYYKNMNKYKDKDKQSSVSVKSSIKMQGDETIIQMITQYDLFNNFSWFGPLHYE